MSEQIVKSEKHPNWICSVETSNGQKPSYFMQHKTFKGYMLSLMKHNGEWHAELLTRQRILGQVSWEPAHNNFFLPLEQAKAEVERRGAYHKTQGVWN